MGLLKQMGTGMFLVTHQVKKKTPQTTKNRKKQKEPRMRHTVGLPENRVKEINTAKGACDEGVGVLSMEIDASLYSRMRKHVIVSKLPQYKFGVVRMGTKVFQTV